MEQNIINVVRQKNSLLPMNKTDYENLVQPRLNNILQHLDVLNNDILNPIKSLTQELLFRELDKASILDLDTTLVLVLKNNNYNLLNTISKIDEYQNITNVIIISDITSYNNVTLPTNCELYMRSNIDDDAIYKIISTQVKTNYFFYLSSDYEIDNFKTSMFSKCKKVLSSYNNVKQILITEEKSAIFTPGMYKSDVFCKFKTLTELINHLVSNKMDMAYLDDKIVTRLNFVNSA